MLRCARNDGSGDADSGAGLVAAFRGAVDDDPAACLAIGKAPDKPPSGKVFLRATPELHARAAVAAKIAGKSLNQFGVEALERATAGVMAGRAVCILSHRAARG